MYRWYFDATSISVCTILKLYHFFSWKPGRSNQVLPSVPMLVVRWKVLFLNQEKRAGSLWPISQQLPSTLANLKISRTFVDCFKKELILISTVILNSGPQCSAVPMRLFFLTIVSSPWNSIWYMSGTSTGVMDGPVLNRLVVWMYRCCSAFLPSGSVSRCRFLMRASAAW